MDINASYLNALSQTLQTGQTSGLEAMKNKDFSQASDEELMEACKEFESYFVEMVMKEVTKGVDLTGGAQSSGNTTLMEYYKDQTISSLAKEQTEHNSLGLAQQMYEQMKRSNNSVTMAEILQHQADLKEEKTPEE